ncbi:MAG TPA: aldo/keto reductase [Azospirillum sp.]|nr:aldo/keto reductase [Azospirillum sp.]
MVAMMRLPNLKETLMHAVTANGATIPALGFGTFLNQDVVLDAARKAGLSVTAYYAMADGKVFADPVLKKIAARHGKSVAQVVLRWIVQQEGLIVLSKTVGEARAAENAEIFRFTLSADDMAAIHALAQPDGQIVSPKELAPVWD